MMDAAIGEARLPEEPPAHSRDAAELAARILWTAFRRHSWPAPALSLSCSRWSAVNRSRRSSR